VYLQAYQDVGEAWSASLLALSSNHERLHQALGYRTPRQVFEEALQVAKPRCRRNTAGANNELAAQ
jgi:hypothetical protein